ncbi:MAG: hypothetical protein ACRDCW_14565 [Sarcina sp.]
METLTTREDGVIVKIENGVTNYGIELTDGTIIWTLSIGDKGSGGVEAYEKNY